MNYPKGLKIQEKDQEVQPALQAQAQLDKIKGRVERVIIMSECRCTNAERVVSGQRALAMLS